MRQNKPLRKAYFRMDHIRRQLIRPGCMRLMLAFVEKGGDPLTEWKKAGNQISRRLKHRLPGDWKTKRGIKKRKMSIAWFM